MLEVLEEVEEEMSLTPSGPVARKFSAKQRPPSSVAHQNRDG